MNRLRRFACGLAILGLIGVGIYSNRGASAPASGSAPTTSTPRSTAQPTPASPIPIGMDAGDVNFVATLRANGMFSHIPVRQDVQIAGTARGFCQTMSQDQPDYILAMDLRNLRESIAGIYGMSEEQATGYIGLTAQTYCPYFTDLTQQAFG